MGIEFVGNRNASRIYGNRTGRRYSGLDFSAVVQSVVPGSAAETNGPVLPGYFLLAANGKVTTKVCA